VIEVILVDDHPIVRQGIRSIILRESDIKVVAEASDGFEAIKLVKENLGQDLKITGALLTMYNRNNKISREVVKEIRRNFPGYVFDTVIPRQVCLAEAPRFGKTILQYAPTSSAAQSYRELAQELLNRENKDNPIPQI